MVRFAILGLLLASFARAQTVSGTIIGKVLDAAGSPMAGVSVKLTSEDTAATRRLSSDDHTGDFSFNAIPPGMYTLTIEHPGFKQYQKRNIELTASDRLSTGDVRLELGAVTDVSDCQGRGFLCPDHQRRALRHRHQ